MSMSLQYCSVKTVLMRNIGNAEAKFTMDVDKYICLHTSIANKNYSSYFLGHIQ